MSTMSIPATRRTPEMTETRIRWERTGYGWRSSVGLVDNWPFQIWNTTNAPTAWRLKSNLPGPSKPAFRDDPDELMAEAERLLEEFVSSLGAVFPERYAGWSENEGGTAVQIQPDSPGDGTGRKAIPVTLEASGQRRQ
jgi:hypothetical protein